VNACRNCRLSEVTRTSRTSRSMSCVPSPWISPSATTSASCASTSRIRLSFGHSSIRRTFANDRIRILRFEKLHSKTFEHALRMFELRTSNIRECHIEYSYIFHHYTLTNIHNRLVACSRASVRYYHKAKLLLTSYPQWRRALKGWIKSCRRLWRGLLTTKM